MIYKILTLLGFLCLFVLMFILIQWIIRKRVSKTPDTEYLNSQRPEIDKRKFQEKENDKMVIVMNVVYESLRNVIGYVCNLYNKEEFTVQPRLFKLSNTKFAITFPYDISFEKFCYFINYLKYPEGLNFNYEPSFKGWTTVRKEDLWVGQKFTNQRIMLFIPDEDKEYDNVYFTTVNEETYKLGFSVFKKNPLLLNDKMEYTLPPVDWIL